MHHYVQITDLIGKTLTAVEGATSESERIVLKTEGETYAMFHEQDCCESVMVEDVVGDVTDLIGVPILGAYEEKNSIGGLEDPCEGSCTWTFYRMVTIKGTVTIRWYGSSNGYYSESVSLCRVAQ